MHSNIKTGLRLEKVLVYYGAVTKSFGGGGEAGAFWGAASPTG